MDEELDELEQALEQLRANEFFTVFTEELRKRRDEVILRAEEDRVIRDHPTLISCVAYSRCLGELLELIEERKSG